MSGSPNFSMPLGLAEHAMAPIVGVLNCSELAGSDAVVNCMRSRPTSEVRMAAVAFEVGTRHQGCARSWLRRIRPICSMSAGWAASPIAIRAMARISGWSYPALRSLMARRRSPFRPRPPLYRLDS